MQQLLPSIAPTPASALRIVSWNLFHEDGATLEDIRLLMQMTRPDILLMQEARTMINRLPDLIGGYYNRVTLPGRVHGTACWSRLPFAAEPQLYPLPPGLIVRRFAQLLKFEIESGPFSVANVHLSHGQVLNRRQLRLIRNSLDKRAIIMGDFNIVGPALLPNFHDVGPRETTHRMLNHVPFRLDRCLVHGFSSLGARVYPRFGSDHYPIAVTLIPSALDY
ncbi:endonuclease/exonuclease/phosphatase family protein [Saccharibacter sp. 17.LH.SD]|uniref:endonuclease/exonuclease/phosphatase family protein n=1 Tax=Saccharibacter sp. 17.LH.SD TaxID=2689393 RepID=UPI00136BD040|nr:endonuclease/exonuclease/phosphatase family protein [Saccharibacter sp. 17.LH.SD]MXV44215.1 endonuclease/exonuclease/phosphatase family protein [Saccharibacter sp. 17.LH.SD]